MSAGWVFGYGSLVAPGEPHGSSPLGAPREVNLIDHRRRWNVAMWNTAARNDAKHYLDPVTGERPPVHVAFLNIEPAPGQLVNGVIIPLDEATLAGFDLREVNYRRVDVTQWITPRPTGRVWTYVAEPAGLERFQDGLRAGDVVVAGEYLEYCRAAFAARGAHQLERFDQTTEPLPCPVRVLTLWRASSTQGS